ncbi:MAG: anthranilate phosphoribosyltransferase family protein [Synechococcales bacterium]|nr:anthranilate phosphoribosyltransferase family protein [Synechococcales bacterium]
MSLEFRELLRKIGSGPHTGENLTRTESHTATRLLLLQEATPAQIGAFMIAHRIKRPTGEELAGMLDAYAELGPQLQPIASSIPVLIMGIPYDGRSRTAPISPVTSLILAAVGVAVIQHGGNRMPTKDGVPLVELWNALGVDWRSLSLVQMQQVLESSRLGFVYLPNHFPLAEAIVPYRDQIGKRPPFATLELMWSPYAGVHQLTCGFVHPPTENMFRIALGLRGQSEFLTVKGLEGSCDLPRDRTGIIGIAREGEFERLHLVPRDYGFANRELPLTATEDWAIAVQQTLAGEASELTQAVIWNAGFYLWRCGIAPDLESGFQQAQEILNQGKAQGQLQLLQQQIQQQVQLLTVS